MTSKHSKKTLSLISNRFKLGIIRYCFTPARIGKSRTHNASIRGYGSLTHCRGSKCFGKQFGITDKDEKSYFCICKDETLAQDLQDAHKNADHGWQCLYGNYSLPSQYTLHCLPSFLPQNIYGPHGQIHLPSASSRVWPKGNPSRIRGKEGRE